MSWTHERAKVAALSRSRTPDDPELLDAKRRMHALRLEEHVRRVVAEAPPFTAAQRDRLVTIIRGGA